VTRPIKDKDLDDVLRNVDRHVGNLVRRVWDPAVRKEVTIGEQARRRALDFVPGPGSGWNVGGNVRSTDVPDPTQRAAMRHHHQSENWPEELGEAMRALDAAAAKAIGIVSAIVSHAAAEFDEDGIRQKKVGAGHCLACDYLAAGTAEDRLRGGLCDADRKRWQRAQDAWGNDRVPWLRAMRIANGLDPLTAEQQSVRDSLAEQLRRSDSKRPRRPQAAAQ
jgi:hypothetical protein